jgi:hypothetical protein
MFCSACLQALGETQACMPMSASAGNTPPLNVEYILVVDSTGSMHNKTSGGKTRWDELREKLVASIAAIPIGNEQRLHLLVFGAFVSTPPNWQGLPPQLEKLAGDRTSAVFLTLNSEAERERIIALIRAHSPAAAHTALNDAIAAGFDRAVTLHAENPNRQFLIAVFSDGEDNFSSRFPGKAPKTLAAYVHSAEAQLGESLVNVHYFYVRVAGLSMSPPTPDAIVIDRTPVLATVSLRPEKAGVEVIDAGTLAGHKEETGLVNVAFDLRGLNSKSFPVYFDPLPAGASKPQVAVVCEAGAKAAFGVPGVYQIKFRRIGSAADYEKPFEGYLRLDLGDYAYSTVAGVRLSQISPPIRVRFAGAAIAAVDFKPADGTGVLAGNSLRFESAPRPGAKYLWSFTGAEKGSAEGPVVSRILRQAGQLNVELKVTQDGFVIPPVTHRIKVVDPQFKFTVDPATPVEGERVGVTLDHGPQIQVSDALWTPQAKSVVGATATYEFTETGEKELNVSVNTDLGPAHAATKIKVGPGVPLPVLTLPELNLSHPGDPFVTVYKQDEPQRFEAEVGQGVEAVRFILLQGNQETFSQIGKASDAPNRRVARIDFSYPASLQPGAAQLALLAVPKDPSITTRLGERKSVYKLEVSKFAFSIERVEPVSSELLWDRDTSFVAAMGGEGRKKVTSLEWKVELINLGGQAVPVLSHIQKPDEWPDGSASLVFQLDWSDPRLQALKRDAWLKVTAVPQGDQNTIAGQLAIWDGLRPKLQPADFLIQCPPQLDLDAKGNISVVDARSGNRAEKVMWELIGEDSNPLAALHAASLPVEAHRPGPHTLRATVSWAAGDYLCAEKSFFVSYEPVTLLDATWDGGQKPVIRGRGKAESDTTNVRGVLRGSRALLVVDVQTIVNEKVAGSIPGYPKQFAPSDIVRGFSVPYPRTPLKGGHAEQLVTLRTKGLDYQGRPVEQVVCSYKIINEPPRPVLLILALLVGALLTCFMIRKLMIGNEARYFTFRAFPDSNDRQTLQSCLQSLAAQDGGDLTPDARKRFWNDLSNRFLDRFRKDNPRIAPQNIPSDFCSVSAAAHWNKRSWWTKRASVPLNKLVPTSDVTAWPLWFTTEAGDLGYFNLYRKGKEPIVEPAIWANSTCTNPSLTLKCERPTDFDTIERPSECKSVLEIEPAAGGDRVHVIIWDRSGTSEAQKTLSRYKVIRRCAYLLVGLLTIFILQQLYQ